MKRYASKNVSGWNDRYLHSMKVIKLLEKRREKFLLNSEERKFLEDMYSLIKLYN